VCTKQNFGQIIVVDMQQQIYEEFNARITEARSRWMKKGSYWFPSTKKCLCFDDDDEEVRFAAKVEQMQESLESRLNELKSKKNVSVGGDELEIQIRDLDEILSDLLRRTGGQKNGSVIQQQQQQQQQQQRSPTRGGGSISKYSAEDMKR
jgi:hypothetical protein